MAIQQVHRVLDGARHRGLELGPLLARAGIAEALLESPLARVSQQQYARLLRVLRRALRDELWGLASRPLPPGSFALCARQLLRLPTLEAALREGFALHRVWIDDFIPRLDRDGPLARLRLQLRVPVTPRVDFLQKAFLLFSFGLASWLVARRVPLVAVDYTDGPGSEASRVYQAPIRHGQPQLGLVFEARWLSLPVVQDPQSLRDFLALAPANLLVKYRDTGSTSERIRRQLRRRLGADMPSLEQLARQLSTSPQTLRRHLRAEGHAFQSLKDSLRRDAAIAWLADPGLSLDAVAQRVGFSEASSFQRAFKKWTGLPPGAYRQARDGASR